MNWAVQPFDEPPIFLGHPAICSDRAYRDAHPAGGRIVVAAQEYRIRGICVEVELGVGGVAAAGTGAVVGADVPHGRNIVAGLALRAADAGVQAYRPRQELEILLVQAVARQAADERHPAPACGFSQRGIDGWPSRPQVEILPAIVQQCLVRVPRLADGLDQIAPRAVVQRINPAPVAFQLRCTPGRGRIRRGNVHVRHFVPSCLPSWMITNSASNMSAVPMTTMNTRARNGTPSSA